MRFSRAMTIGIVAVCFGHVPIAHAQMGFSAMQQRAQCQLQYGSNTRAPLAVQSIQTACADLAANMGMLGERQRQYDRCLLQYLQSAQSNAAAQQTIAACRQAIPLL